MNVSKIYILLRTNLLRAGEFSLVDCAQRVLSAPAEDSALATA